MRLLLFTTFLLLLPLWNLPAEETVPARTAPPAANNSVLASVNGVPISLIDVLGTTRDSEYRAAAVFSGKRLEEEILNIRRKAVDELIDRQLVLDTYRKGPNPTPIPNQAIEEELDKVAERMGVRSRAEFTRKLRQSGTNIDKLRKDIEEYLIFHMMVYDQIRIESSITPREVYEYYQANQEEFVHPEQVGLALIMLRSSDSDMEQKSEMIARQLTENPDAFAEIAQKHSEGPAAENGGFLGEIERKRLRTEFAAAMPELEAGRIYGPVRTAEGVSFLKIVSYAPEKKGDFRTLAPEIRGRIDEKQREQIRESYLFRLRSDAIIRYFF